MDIPEDFAQVTYRFEGTQVPNGAAVVFGVQNVAELTAQQLATAARTAATTGLMTNISAGVSIVEVLAKLGPSATGPSASATGAITGSIASAAGMQPAAAYLISKNTALGGRRGKGRLFFPGVDESVVDNQGTISAGQVTALQAELTEWLGNLSTAGIPMVLLHGPETEWVLVNGQPRRVPSGSPTVYSPNNVTSLALQTRIATQRRRLRR